MRPRRRWFCPRAELATRAGSSAEGSCSRRYADPVGFCRMYRNEAAMIVGAFSLPIGVIGTPFSIGLAGEVPEAGIALTIASTVLSAGGIGLLIWGAPRVPAVTAPERMAAWSIEPVVGPGFGALRGAF